MLCNIDVCCLDFEKKDFRKNVCTLVLQAEDFQLPDTSESYRDLSAWRVSIPRVDTRQDANNKPFPVFSISVQRIDVKAEGI